MHQESNLLDFAEKLICPDPSPGQPVLDVGEWSLEKHELLRRYVGASWAARRQFRNRAFIDLYCGPGRVHVRDTDVETDGGSVVAWREARKHGGAFNQIVVGDLDDGSADACAFRLSALDAPVQTLQGTAETTVDNVLNMVPRDGLHLAYLDPFNMEHLPFSIIEKLARYRSIDIVVHFSVMDLQRDVELDFSREASRFEAFAPGWRNHVNMAESSKHEVRRQFTSYWFDLVRSLGFKHAKEQPLITNSKNGPLYRMVFLMRHPLAEKLWNDVAKPLNRRLFD